MKSEKKSVDRAYACGYAAALADLVHIHDQPTMAADLLRTSGLSDEVARYASPYDYKILKGAEPTLRRPKVKL